MTARTPVWFITGASSGFGRFMALEALSRGHQVIASGRNTAKLAELADKGIDTVTLDVTAPLSDIQKIAKKSYEKYGHITHLVNAAGYLLVGAVEETSPEEDFNHFDANVFGMLNVSKAFLPYLRATPGEKTISNFGSLASWVGGAGYALYTGTKWACSGISEAMRAELEPFNIRVTVIEPGYFRTGFLNAEAQVSSAVRLKVYDDTQVGKLRAGLSSMDNKQPGDVAKGSKILIDILTHTGVAEGTDIPVRVALGSDSPTTIRKKLQTTEALLSEWNSITTNTDHDS
ncbi:short chain dehydrogenase [Stagonosporopsis vannaccii]|nr:short chain dehydrogenase [Stagonosporopsis vannaccii]